MSRETRSVPGYEHLPAGGGRPRRFSGVEARLADAQQSAEAPEANWLISAATIGGVTPRAGDRCWGTDGVRRTVQAVGELAGGEWPVSLRRVGQ
jgi:hypothetical protein